MPDFTSVVRVIRPASSPPSLADLRRLDDGLRKIDMQEFVELHIEAVGCWPASEAWNQFYEAPLSYCAEPGHGEKHVAALVRMAWELGE